MKRAAVVLSGALALLGGPVAWAMDMGHGGGAAGPKVSIGYSDYMPAKIDVVAGDTITWTNDSTRRHTVTADNGSFSSAPLIPGETYSRRFDAPGAVPYFCQLHPGIRGEVDVHALLLDAPAAPAAPNQPFPLRGRTALPGGGSVTIEGDEGAGFSPVASAGVATDGSFAVSITPRTTTTYRAVADDGTRSDPVRLLVLDRKVAASVTRHGRRVTVSASVTPATPGSTVVLQLRLPERFGWWPVARTKLDKASRARFTIPLTRHVPARVVLTLPDGATRLATSPALTTR